MARSEAGIPATRLVAAPLPLALRCTLGEGPRWDERAGELVWVDIDGPCVHRWRPGERDVRTLTLAEQVGAVAARAGGGLVAATGAGLSLIEASGERATPWLELPQLDLATSRLNDGRADAAGRLWVGAMARDVASPIARLYRVDPDGGVTIAMERLTISNGIGFAPGDRAMYHVDTPTQRVRRYPFSVAGGTLGDGEDFAVIPAHQGAPDGLAVDADGGVWVALWGGGAVHRYAPDGTLDAVVELPGARHVTAVAFGGTELDELYITTARAAGEPADGPFAGALHHCRPGVRGMPEHRFAA